MQEKVPVTDQTLVGRLYNQLSMYNTEEYPDNRYMLFISIRLAVGLDVINRSVELVDENLDSIEDDNAINEICRILISSNNSWSVISEIITISSISTTHKNTYVLDESNISGRCPDFACEIDDKTLFIENKRKNYAVNDVPESPVSNICDDISSSKFNIAENYNSIKLFQIHVPYFYNLSIRQILKLRRNIRNEMEDTDAVLITSFGPMRSLYSPKYQTNKNRIGLERWLLKNNDKNTDNILNNTYKKPELDWNYINYLLSKKYINCLRCGFPKDNYIYNGMPMCRRRYLYKKQIPYIKIWQSDEYKKFKKNNPSINTSSFKTKI